MQFLVDAQLPPALARWLATNGFESKHVYDLDMGSASDETIWRWAQDKGAVIITKDEDFAAWRAEHVTTPPAVVWLRVGNTRRKELLQYFDSLFPAIIDRLNAGEMLIEIR